MDFRWTAAWINTGQRYRHSQRKDIASFWILRVFEIQTRRAVDPLDRVARFILRNRYQRGRYAVLTVAPRDRLSVWQVPGGWL